MSTIKPRLLKGFRDFLPQQLWLRRKVINTFIEVFEKYGYEPLETPALEYFDILMGKYGEQEKLVYNFEDFGGRKVALKYDLTVPASRVMAQYQNDLSLPWKRYQIQPVWRADNTQKGRFREFYQCDADIFGSKDMVADAEFIEMGIEILSKLGFKDFKVRINNRKLLNGIATYIGRPEKFNDMVFVIDDWDKRELEANKEELMKRGFSESEVNKIVDLILSPGESLARLDKLQEKLSNIPEAIEGIGELQKIFELVANEKLTFDLSIARGLSYYTGPVWEWSIVEGRVGSVGGCGRYDKLVGGFTGMDIPATGGSFGLERIMEVLSDREMLSLQETNIRVMVSIFNEKLAKESFNLATDLRNRGIPTLLYPQIKPLKKQFEYADKKGIPYVIIIGEDELSLNVVALKDMKKKKQTIMPLADALNILLNEDFTN
jgi:histidyl-tRNA synthetase